MDPTRVCIKITYFSLFFKYVNDITCLNQHRSHGFTPYYETIILIPHIQTLPCFVRPRHKPGK